MDYVAANIAADPSKQQDNYFPGANTVGGYDKLAIKYGYTIVKNEKEGIEQQVLKDIAKSVEVKDMHLLQMVIRKKTSIGT